MSLSRSVTEERFLSRQELAKRWGVGMWTVINREREGIITPIRFNPLCVRYKLSEIEQLEQAAVGAPQAKPGVGVLRRNQLLAAKKKLGQ
jgi:hypothetical protein